MYSVKNSLQILILLSSVFTGLIVISKISFANQPESKSLQTKNTSIAASDTISQKNRHKNWRKDSSIKRRPASYIGGSLNYQQMYAWMDANDDHKKLSFGPIHGFAPTFRVGDALTEYFCLGFQVQFLMGSTTQEKISSFTVLLDTSFYPLKGLGIRPSAGFGFSFAQGKNKWEFGNGGPGTLALALLYEFRVSKTITLAPIIQSTFIASNEYKSLAILFGVELTAWFKKQYSK